MVLVAMAYATNFLDAQMAGNEFSSNEQFMQTMGLQIDDVAWTIGRTQTTQYTVKFGHMTFVPAVINYTFDIINNTAWNSNVLNCTTGMIIYNMPVSYYSLGVNYSARILPVSNGSFLQQGASAPVSQVFAREQVPMANGTYSRIVVVPTVRLLNSTMTTQQGTFTDFKFYLPFLVSGSSPHLSQSVTLTGTNIGRVIVTVPSLTGTVKVRITANYLAPASNPPGFGPAFFTFDHRMNETVTVKPGDLLEFYTGTVVVSMGMSI
jgi:hypothetical protein